MWGKPTLVPEVYSSANEVFSIVFLLFTVILPDKLLNSLATDHIVSEESPVISFSMNIEDNYCISIIFPKVILKRL